MNETVAPSADRRSTPRSDSALLPPDERDDMHLALRAIVEGTATATGTEFFFALVRELAQALNVRHAFVSELLENKVRVRTLAFWFDGKLTDNIEFDLGECSHIDRHCGFLVLGEGFGMGEGMPEAQGEVDHLILLAHDLGPARESAQVVAGIRVVLFDSDGVRFTDPVPFGGQHLGEGIPVVGKEAAAGQVPDFGVKPAEGASITTAHNPGDTSP